MSLLLLASSLLLGAPTAADTVRARLIATIDDAAAVDPPIGEMSSIAIDAQGRVYVGDLQEPRILVFDAQGKQVATIGRKGEGPGEFTAPTGIVIGPDGALYVRNMRRVLRFVATSPNGIPGKFDRGFDGPPMAPWRSKLPSIIDRAGRFYFPLEVGREDGLTYYGYKRYRLDGTYVDSLPVPTHSTSRSSWSSAMISPGTGRMIAGINVVPFHPIPQWTFTPNGNVLSGAADSPLLIETDTKKAKVREFSVAGAPVAIPAAERAESLRALNRRIDTLPVALSTIDGVSDEVRQKKLPTTYPQFRALRMTGDAVWLVRWTLPPLRSSTVIDEASLDGKVLRTIVLPVPCVAVPLLAVEGRRVACMTVDPETGSEALRILALP